MHWLSGDLENNGENNNKPSLSLLAVNHSDAQLKGVFHKVVSCRCTNYASRWMLGPLCSGCMLLWVRVITAFGVAGGAE